ncbi:hypothetical protein PIB30_050679 [Stylosanthes scabra]|uniref:Uncharacterized protein n=1 Tax=Stylosanthes scabra TaxID=79078 RepID=A0ABU6ZGF9_9FABA|nr:hypothetical protein [Stylosanthes scabra]
MAMKKSSVIHAQQIIMLHIIIIIGIVTCFVIAESHEIVPNNKESWTQSYYYYYSKELGTPSYYITSIDSERKLSRLRECLHHCIELIKRYWPRHREDPTPPGVIQQCIDDCIHDLDKPFS